MGSSSCDCSLGADGGRFMLVSKSCSGRSCSGEPPAGFLGRSALLS